MAPRHPWLWLCAMACVVSLALSPPKLSRAQGLPVLAVVVSARNTTTDMPLATLKRVFLGYDVSDGSGGRFIPFNHPAQSSARILFDRQVLGMSANQIGRYWVEQMIRGQARAPRNVPNADLLLKVIAKLPGAISYVDASRVDRSVRALRINGFEPGHPNYPLR